MGLSGKQREKLYKALIDAFRSKNSLKRMLSFKLEKQLDTIVGGDNYEDVVFNLIEKAESENWVEDLIQAANQENPGNQLLNDIANELSVPQLVLEEPKKEPEAGDTKAKESETAMNGAKTADNQQVVKAEVSAVHSKSLTHLKDRLKRLSENW